MCCHNTSELGNCDSSTGMCIHIVNVVYPFETQSAVFLALMHWNCGKDASPHLLRAHLDLAAGPVLLYSWERPGRNQLGKSLGNRTASQASPPLVSSQSFACFL